MSGGRGAFSRRPPRRLRIAYFSPLPPARSGIADYSMALLPPLSELADITVYTAAPARERASWPAAVALRSLDLFAAERREQDMALYHMGNSEHHAREYELLTRFPGVVVLHDYFLHHFVAAHTLGRGEPGAYQRELAYAQGVEGLRIARAVRLGCLAPPVIEHPLNERVLGSSLGVLVHSHYVAARVQRQSFAGPVQVVPALIEPRTGRSRREELGLAPGTVLFASAGLITAAKQIAEILTALQRLRELGIDAHYLLVGSLGADVPIQELIGEMSLGEVVHVLGYVESLDTFVDWIATADVIVNLRQPTGGETSATALRAMAAAKPLIVHDDGWYSELPDDAAIKIAPGDPQALLAAMRRLATAADGRAAMGAAGRQYTMAVCRPAAVAQQYIAALEAILAYYWDRYG